MSSREIMEAQGFTKQDDFRDPVVKRVVQKFRDRSDAGFIKYGTTLHEERTTKMKGLLKYPRRTYGCNIVFTNCTRRN